MGTLLILIYNFFWLMVYVLTLPYTLYKRKKSPEEWLERMGRYPFDFSKGKRSIWIHAASLGEIVAASQLVKRLQQRYPRRRIVVSAMTAGGKQRAAEEITGGTTLMLMPFDFLPLMRKAIRSINPETLILVETEIWPSLLFLARKRGVHVVLANGRLSDRTYRRYLRLWPLSRWLFNQIDLYIPKNDEEREKFIQLGVQREKIKLSGCLKSENGIRMPVSREDLFIPEKKVILVAGSVRKGEEEIVILAFKRVQREQEGCYLIIAPRHLNRVAEIVSLLGKEKLRYMKRTEKRSYEGEQVLILDTVGELRNVYAVADAAFVGGTLLPYGGHNPLEPAYFGVPILFGSHVENIRTDAAELLGSHCAIMVRDGKELSDVLCSLLRNPERRAMMGRKAIALLEQKQGIVEKYIAVLAENGVL
jgi:3-deoxy-D-manno-octulosonic-acid transferase